jgi:hypothetical protein
VDLVLNVPTLNTDNLIWTEKPGRVLWTSNCVESRLFRHGGIHNLVPADCLQGAPSIIGHE